MDGTAATSSEKLARHPDVQAILGRDLKANLLILKNMIANDTVLPKALDTQSLTALRKAVDFLLADISGQQGRAAQNLDSAEPYQVFSHTLPFKGQEQAAKLNIYYPKKQKMGSKNGFRISLLLSMSRLGDLRTDLYLREKDLAVTFFVKDPATQTRIQESYLQLNKILKPLFEQISISVILSEKKIKDFDRQDVQPPSERRVDLRI
jgi:hypothetical protein